jgi:hypothetical protein
MGYKAKKYRVKRRNLLLLGRLNAKSEIFSMQKELAEQLYGAGEGNRTLVFSLEGCCSTIELHPRSAFAKASA